MKNEVSLKHFVKAAKEIGSHGDNDTLPFDIDNKFISDRYENIAKVAFNFFQRMEKKGDKGVQNTISSLSIFHERLLTPSGMGGSYYH